MRSTIRTGLLLPLCLLFAFAARAQTTLPTVTAPLPAVSATAGVAVPTIDLKGHFGIAGVTNQVVQFDTVLGAFNIEVLPSAAPLSVLNFLNYVNRGAYANSFIHRSDKRLGVIQGGGFTISGTTIYAVPADPAIALEYNLANTRGTLSMARTAALNSATSQWFINTVDNTTTLGAGNAGGYAVFARVLGTGMSVVDAIAALTVYDASAQLGSTYTQLPLRGPSLSVANLALVNSVRSVSVMPGGSAAPAVLTLAASSSNPAVATAAISGSILTVTPLGGGACTLTVRATDTNGNFVEGSFNVTVSATPSISTHPLSQTVAENGPATLTVVPLGSAAAFSYRWFHNGVEVAGATGAELQLANVQCAQAGLYIAEVTAGANTARSRPAVIGLAPAAENRTAGSVTTRSAWQNIVHPNGKIYDQYLLTGQAGTITADAGQIARISLLDEQDNIVQFEMSGPGSLTVVLANPSGPKPPALYNQPGIEYMQGTPTVILSGTEAATYMSIYSVGKNTNPGVTRADVTYNGWANVRGAGIHSATGALGGLFYGNVLFASAAGPAGIAAPSVRTVGTLNFHELTTTAAGQPMILLAPDGQANIKVTGGNLGQPGGSAIAVSGLDTVRMVAGQGSSGQEAAAQPNQGRLLFEGIDITADLIIGP